MDQPCATGSTLKVHGAALHVVLLEDSCVDGAGFTL